MKICNGCLIELPLSEFWKWSTSRDGRHPKCKDCAREYHRSKWARSDPDQRFYRRARQKFGLTQNEAERLLGLHGRSCWACGRDGTRTAIDHDHDTGRVRGVLCVRCNVALGVLDNPGLIRTLKDYLARPFAYDDECPYGAALADTGSYAALSEAA